MSVPGQIPHIAAASAKTIVTEQRLGVLIARLTASGGVTIGHAAADGDSNCANDGDSDMGTAAGSYSQSDTQALYSRYNNLKNLYYNPAASRINNLKSAYNDLEARFNNLVDALQANGTIAG